MLRISGVSLFLSIVLAVSAGAEIIHLKDGQKLEGTILSEDDLNVVVEVQESASIKDERSIPKSDIDRIEKVQPDELAWQEVKDLQVGADSFTGPQYEAMIGQIREFVSAHPTSSHSAEAKANLEKLKEEHIRVKAGELKMEQEWLGPDKVAAERIQLTGMILLNGMKQHVARRQYPEAMNSLDRLEKTALGSRAYPDAIELGKRILPAYKEMVTQRTATLKAQMAEQKKQIMLKPEPERSKANAAIEAHISKVNAQLNLLTATQKWPPAGTVTEASLARASSLITSETMRLNNLPVAKMREAIVAGERASVAIENNDPASAEAALNSASIAWSAYELLGRLRTKLTALKNAPKAPVPAETAAVPEAEPKKEEEKPVAKTEKSEPAPAPPAESVQERRDDPPIAWLPIATTGAVLLCMVGGGWWAFRRFVAPENNILDQ